MSERPKCLTCPHWELMELKKAGPPSEYSKGMCLRYPPQLTAAMHQSEAEESAQDIDLWSQPWLQGYNSCGEHPDFPAWAASRRLDSARVEGKD